MSQSNIERMVDALVRDEMNMVRQMTMGELDLYVESLVRTYFENLSNKEIIAEYEMLGD